MKSENSKAAPMAKKHLDPIPLGEILLEEFLLPLGISQNRLARDLDVNVARISEIVKENVRSRRIRRCDWPNISTRRRSCGLTCNAITTCGSHDAKSGPKSNDVCAN